MTDAELLDELEQAISDSFDLDWQPAWAARAVLPIVQRERQELVQALHQYRSDLLYPPAPDSRERRIARIDALIARYEVR